MVLARGNKHVLEDFIHGASMLLDLADPRRVLQVVGWCEASSQIVTEVRIKIFFLAIGIIW